MKTRLRSTATACAIATLVVGCACPPGTVGRGCASETILLGNLSADVVVFLVTDEQGREHQLEAGPRRDARLQIESGGCLDRPIEVYNRETSALLGKLDAACEGDRAVWPNDAIGPAAADQSLSSTV